MKDQVSSAHGSVRTEWVTVNFPFLAIVAPVNSHHAHRTILTNNREKIPRFVCKKDATLPIKLTFNQLLDLAQGNTLLRREVSKEPPLACTLRNRQRNKICNTLYRKLLEVQVILKTSVYVQTLTILEENIESYREDRDLNLAAQKRVSTIDATKLIYSSFDLAERDFTILHCISPSWLIAKELPLPEVRTLVCFTRVFGLLLLNIPKTLVNPFKELTLHYTPKTRKSQY